MIALFQFLSISPYIPLSGSIGNLEFFLARDMGLAPPVQLLEAVDNLGLGEVVDSSPPPTPHPVVEDRPYNPLSLMERPRKRSRKDPFFEAAAKDEALPFKLVINIELKSNSNEISSAGSSSKAGPSAKGKEKVYEGYAFNNDGLLDREAINIIDNGILKHISKEMGKVVINLDASAENGQCLKDILKAEMLKNLHSLNLSRGPSVACSSQWL
ncbi:hypothetical protein ACET3Z_018843 [Daucus carota]